LITAEIGRLHQEAGRLDEARRHYADARRDLPADHPEQIALDEFEAELHLEAGDPKAALALLERALQARDAGAGAPLELARTRFGTAIALWDAKVDRPRARALAGRARQVPGDSRAAREFRERVDAWLAEHTQ
jgi:tetratricopeptide (TPR) repeat protein